MPDFSGARASHADAVQRLSAEKATAVQECESAQEMVDHEKSYLNLLKKDLAEVDERLKTGEAYNAASLEAGHNLTQFPARSSTYSQDADLELPVGVFCSQPEPSA